MFDILGTLAIALSVLLFIYAGFRTFKRKAPRWLYPLAIGASMFTYAVYSDYSWASRAMSQIPDDIKLVERGKTSTGMQPWTLLFPRTDRLLLVDTNSIQTSDQMPNHRLVEFVTMGRYDPTVRLQQVVDCKDREMADITKIKGGASPEVLREVHWFDMSDTPRLFEVVCQPG